VNNPFRRRWAVVGLSEVKRDPVLSPSARTKVIGGTQFQFEELRRCWTLPGALFWCVLLEFTDATEWSYLRARYVG
jgi:hypothetical protein